jgi:hypothetical protein
MRNRFSTLVAFVLLAAVVAVVLFGGQGSRGATNYPGLPISGAAYVFAAPHGWNRVQATTLGLGVWLHPHDTGYTQNISARAEEYSGTLEGLTKKMVAHIQSQNPQAEIGKIQRTTVCGGHPAVYLSYAAVVKGQDLIYEQMLTIWGTTAYAAQYTRAATQPALHEARASLTTLCGGHAPPGTVTATPFGRPVPSNTPSVLTNINTVAPMATYGAPAATITPRLGP